MEDEIERLTELLRAYETICERYQAVFAVKYRPADETIADRVYAMSPHTGNDCKVCNGPDDELLQEIEKHNSAKAQLLHEIYQAGLLDSDPYKKERAKVLLSGRLPEE